MVIECLVAQAAAAGLGLGQLQLFAIRPTLPTFESCLF